MDLSLEPDFDGLLTVVVLERLVLLNCFSLLIGDDSSIPLVILLLLVFCTGFFSGTLRPDFVLDGGGANVTGDEIVELVVLLGVIST